MVRDCLLVDPNCKGNCEHCGWDPMEARRRKSLIEGNGLTLSKKGLRRLIIKRERKSNGGNHEKTV